jgi:hypothetical protein
VLSELVASSVERAHAVVELDSSQVRSASVDAAPGFRTSVSGTSGAGRGWGQRDTVLLAHQWGVAYLRYAQKVWAVPKPAEPRHARPGANLVNVGESRRRCRHRRWCGHQASYPRLVPPLC